MADLSFQLGPWYKLVTSCLTWDKQYISRALRTLEIYRLSHAKTCIGYTMSGRKYVTCFEEAEPQISVTLRKLWESQEEIIAKADIEYPGHSLNTFVVQNDSKFN